MYKAKRKKKILKIIVKHCLRHYLWPFNIISKREPLEALNSSCHYSCEQFWPEWNILHQITLNLNKGIMKIIEQLMELPSKNSSEHLYSLTCSSKIHTIYFVNSYGTSGLWNTDTENILRYCYMRKVPNQLQCFHCILSDSWLSYRQVFLWD